MTVAAILLAAGAGSRFDGTHHKLTADLRGEPVVVHSLRAVLGAGFNRVVVVTGSVDLDPILGAVSEGVEVVQNEHWADGQASSVQAGIAAVRDGETHVSSVVVGLGDQPLVGTAAWRAVGAAHGKIVTATFEGRRRPPVKLDRSMWDLLPTEGDAGARLLMRDHPHLVSEVPCLGNPIDIDTLDDLLEVEHYLDD